MSTDYAATENGRQRLNPETQTLSEVEALRATCRRQSLVIDKLGDAMSILRRGTAALKAENKKLRAVTTSEQSGPGRIHADFDESHLIELPLPLDERACSVARSVVTESLCGRVSADAVDNAQSLISELVKVSNSVRRSGASPREPIVVSVQLGDRAVRLAVEDSGFSGELEARTPDIPIGAAVT